MQSRRHQTTGSAKPDPPRRTKPPAPPPPPWWTNWLLLIGLLVTLFLLFRPSGGPAVTTLSYSSFLDRVKTDQVATTVIDANGGVTGDLKSGNTNNAAALAKSGQTQLQKVKG